jgi:hypothetical protein
MSIYLCICICIRLSTDHNGQSHTRSFELRSLFLIFGLGALHTLELADYTVVCSDYTISAGYTLRVSPGLALYPVDQTRFTALRATHASAAADSKI